MYAKAIAIEQLKIDEGLRLKAYPDPLTHAEPWTIGYGHTGGVKPGDTMTEELAEETLFADVDTAAAELDRALPWWIHLDPVRQAILINMCFNMGTRTLLTFVNTLGCIRRGNYASAAEGMRHSLWHKQTGARAERLARQMESGKEHP